MSWRLVALVVLAGCAGCGGCAGSGSSSSSGSGPPTTTTSTTQTTSRAAPRQRRRRPARELVHAPPVGRTQRVAAGGSTLSVTVTKVHDSLTQTGATLLPGMRAAGVELTIHNDRGATYDSTASGDVSVISSSGTAAPLFIKQGVCQTPLTDFESLIGVGETHAGCVGFAVPRRARIVGVRFSPHSRATGNVTWR